MGVRVLRTYRRTQRRIGGFGVALMAIVGQVAEAEDVFAAAGTVSPLISVGDGPESVTLSPDESTAYVSNFDGDSVSVIDTSTNAVTATVTGVDGPGVLAVTPDGLTAYVSSDSASVKVISTATNLVTDTIVLSGNPRGLAMTPDGSAIYVANFSGSNVWRISTATKAVTPITVGSAPYAVAMAPDGAHVYVTNFNSGSVSVIATATDTVVSAVSVGSSPRSLQVTPDNARVYVDNRDSNDVTVIDAATNTVITTVPVGPLPRGLAITPDGAAVYVDNSGDGTMTVIDAATNTVTDTLSVAGVGSEVEYLTVTADGSTAYIADTTEDIVLVLRFLPGGVTTTPGDSNVTVSWDPVNGATSYSVFDATSAAGENTGGAAACTAVTTSCNVGSLSNGTTYYFVVVASFAAGATSPPSAEVFDTPTVSPPPGPTTGSVSPPAPTITVLSSQNPSPPGTGVTFTATLSPSPACGTVSWLIDNVPPSGATPSGAFTLGPVSSLPAGTHFVTAAFSGCSGAGQGSGTVVQEIAPTTSHPAATPPSITADVSGGHERHGWYRAPVRVSFVCTPGSAVLTTPCPDPVVLRRSGKGLSVTRTITAEDGTTATAVTPPINLDQEPPTLHVGSAPALTCEATDDLSGVQSCVVHRHRHTHRGTTVVRWSAAATDVAGNRVQRRGHYRVTS